MRLSLKVFAFLSLTLSPTAAAADVITGTTRSAATEAAVAASVSGPTTDRRADEAESAPHARGGDTALFDSSGTALLLISPPQYFDMATPRGKLRAGGSASGPSFAGAGGGSLIPDAVVVGLGSGVPGPTLGNVSFAAGVPATDFPPIAVPEPSTLLLFGSGLGLCARRWLRRSRAKRWSVG